MLLIYMLIAATEPVEPHPGEIKTKILRTTAITLLYILCTGNERFLIGD